MSNCDVRIDLDKHDGVYNVGDTLKCKVTVSVDEPVKCEDLKLDFFWRTHGRGNRVQGDKHSITLFQGELQPGEHVYEYEYEVNTGPITYHGKLVNLDWNIEARVDIPWKLDPKDKRQFFVRPGAALDSDVCDTIEPDANPLIGMNTRHSHVPISPKKALANFIPMIASILGFIALISIGITGHSLYAYFVAERLEIPQFIFGLTILCIVGSIIFNLLQNQLAERKLGEVAFDVDKSTCKPGDKLGVHLNFKPPEQLQINTITAKLIGHERVVSGSGTNRKIFTHTFFTEELQIPVRGFVGAQEVFDELVSFQVPTNAAPSMSVSDNSVNWRVDIRIDIPNCPDWVRSSYIRIVV